jgi:hypothetical protein
MPESAPRARIKLDTTSVPVNTPFTLELLIEWEGSAGDFIIHPEPLSPPEGLTIISDSFSSAITQSTHTLIYRYRLQAQKKGTYTLPPIAISYWPRNSKKEHTFHTGKITIKAETAHSGVRAATAALGALAFCAGTALFIWIKKKKRSAPHPIPASGTQQQVHKRLEECRRFRLSGDYTGFYRCLQDIADIVAQDDPSLRDTISSLLEQVQFGAQTPEAAQTDHLLREIERRTAAFYDDTKVREEELKKYCR